MFFIFELPCESFDFSFFGGPEAFDAVVGVSFALDQLLLCQLDLFFQLPIQLALDENFFDKGDIFVGAFRSIRNDHHSE